MDNMVIYDATIISRNFEGRGSRFNPEGRKNFTVKFNVDDDVLAAIDAGWPIKVKNIDDEDPSLGAVGYLKVNVNFNSEHRPPRIKLIAEDDDGNIVKTQLNAKTCKIIDTADITNVKLEIVPSFYEKRDGSGEKGVTSYLKTMHFRIVEDIFDKDDDEKSKKMAASMPKNDSDDLPFDDD